MTLRELATRPFWNMASQSMKKERKISKSLRFGFHGSISPFGNGSCDCDCDCDCAAAADDDEDDDDDDDEESSGFVASSELGM